MLFIWAIKIDGNQQAVKVSFQQCLPFPRRQLPVDLLRESVLGLGDVTGKQERCEGK